MRHQAHRLVTLLFVGGLGMLPLLEASGHGAGQDPQQQPPRVRVGANFVRVDAYPTRDGKPVLDLKAEEFEVFEDNTPQRIETFEHVVVRPGGPADRVEVPSQRESLQAAANPRNRVFVIFLDTTNVQFASGRAVTEPLIRLMDRILGPDDLIGVMTPAMAATQVVLMRKTQLLEEGLRDAWPWGTKGTLLKDDREEAYEICYPPLRGPNAVNGNLAQEMITRKRERATLDAVQDLVRYLRDIREERKAILMVTEGWMLYGPNPDMMRLREDPQSRYKEPVPTNDPVVVGPNGKLTTKDPRRFESGTLSKSECDTDRMTLANMDNRRYFLDILEEANYGNSSFYPIDPRGLGVFDTTLAEPAVPINVDMANLKRRLDGLRTMAENTDGLAVVDTNDLDKGLRRISDDLTSYYLLGYSSTNSKLDGRFRSLKVRVKRPGVDVRARRGYKAATEAEVTAARTAAEAPVPESRRTANAAIDKLARIRPDGRFYVHAVPGAGGKLWIAGELQAASGRPDDFARGATADLEVTAGASSTTARVVLKPGERTFVTSVALPPGATGELGVKARLSAAEGSAVPLSDAIRVDPPDVPQALLFRRGVTTGNRLLPATDFRFSRTERVRLEIPVGAEIKPGSARILDRLGQPLQVPVTTGERIDETSGQRWITADANLSSMAAGDFVIEVELTGGRTTERLASGIRVVAR